MNKIIMGLGLIGVMVSNSFSSDLNNENLGDSGFYKDLGLKLKTENFDNLKVDLRLFSRDIESKDFSNSLEISLKTTDFKSIGVGIDNDIMFNKYCNAFKYGGSLEIFNDDKKDAELKIYGSYISNSYIVNDYKLNFLTGVEVVNVFKPTVKDFHKIDVNYRFGTYIENNIYVGWKVLEDENGMSNNLQVEYRF